MAARNPETGKTGALLSETAELTVKAEEVRNGGIPPERSRGTDHSPGRPGNHLTCLRECCLVTATAEGGRVRYDLADQHLADALRIPRRARPARHLQVTPDDCSSSEVIRCPGVQLSINVSDFDAAVTFTPGCSGRLPSYGPAMRTALWMTRR